MSNPGGLSDVSTDGAVSEAVAWALRRESGHWSEAEVAAFEAWCSEDRHHVRTYQEAVRTLADLSAMGRMKELSALLPPLTFRERAVAAVAHIRSLVYVPRARTIFAAVAAAAVALSFMWREYTHPLAYATVAGQVRDITLEDGSVVSLGPGSRIEVAFTRAARNVTLAQGEAFFAVTKSPARPFVVSTGETVVRVVGTKFDVHRGAEEVRVAVVEGVVEVFHSGHRSLVAGDEQSADRAELVDTITAGEQIVASHRGSPEKTRIASIPQPAAWHTGRLNYNGSTLREVVADVNRYYAPGVSLDTNDLGELKVTTSFRPDQVSQFLDTLAIALPVDVERRSDGRLILHPHN